ncbi:MAG: hemolysin, partial [Bacteroidetes bacterium HGW-Bacteroidetes-22]
MQEVIPPVDRELLATELTENKFLRNTNYGSRQIFIVTHHDSPNIMREIGRLREISFRDAGGGTGSAIDIDEFDTTLVPFKQLIVWDPHDEEIVGGYRYIQLKDVDVDEHDNFLSPTAHLFKYSSRF